MRASKLRIKDIYMFICCGVCLGVMGIVLSACGQENGVQNREGQDVIEVPDETESTDGSEMIDGNENSDNPEASGDNGSDSNNSGDGLTDDGNVTYGELSEGDKAPDFAAELASGDKFVLSENSGKVILLNFWATWCGPCVEEMPAFEKLNNEYGDDVKILCVNCVESKSTVDGFIKENGYTFPIAYDEEGIVNYRYPTQGIPYTLVVGKDGVIKSIYLGSAGMEQQYEAYKASIDAALAE
ncbi:MAG: TlpA family protein disulfide reductase [Lachnospiraceae bacterium]|nr:TlpA family protein disulfide reductase [Lachnospiraceae bacterium]